MARLQRLSLTAPRRVICVFGVLAIASAILTSRIGASHPSQGVLAPQAPDDPAVLATRTHFPAKDAASLFAVVTGSVSADGWRDGEARLRRLVAEVEPDARLFELAAPPDPVSNGAPGAQIQLFALVPRGDPQELAARMLDKMPARAGFRLVGPALVAARYSAIASSEIASGERLALPLTFVIAVLAFSSVSAAMVPFVLGLVALQIVSAVLLLVSMWIHLDYFAFVVSSILSLGLAIDYSLFMVSRYRVELHRGLPKGQALETALARVGTAILIACFVIAAALLSLTLVGLGPFTSMAIGGVIAVCVAGIAAVTLLPAILTLLERRLGGGSRRNASAPKAWNRLAAAVTRRPAPILIAVGLGLLLFALPLLSTHLATSSAHDLPRDDPAREGARALARRFGPGVTGPIEVVTRQPPHRIVGELSHVRGISLVLEPERGSDSWSLIRAIPAASPFSATAAAIVSRTRRALAGQRDTHVGGATASDLNLAAYVRARTPLVIAAMAILGVLTLAVGLRSFLVPIKAVLGTLLSVAATLGILALISAVERTGAAEIQLFVPLCLFAVLFGLSVDYEVFLLSRIREAAAAGASPEDSVRIGLSGSARPITFAALTFGSVFLPLSASSLSLFRQFGLGIVVGVVIDATLVRCFLIPTATLLVWRWNWWWPGARRSSAAGR